MNTEQEALLAAIRHDPEDDVPRLVYADWLQERGHDGRAEFIRVQCELAGLLGGWEPRTWTCLDMHLDPQDGEAQEWKHRVWGLQGRQVELFSAPGRAWLPDCGGQLREWHFGAVPPGAAASRPFGFVVRRGFAEAARFSWPDWLAHHADFLAHPDVVLRRVELTTRPDARWVLRAGTRRLGMGGMFDFLEPQVALFESISTPAEARPLLTAEFPGHCPNHPIEWVLPGES